MFQQAVRAITIWRCRRATLPLRSRFSSLSRELPTAKTFRQCMTQPKHLIAALRLLRMTSPRPCCYLRGYIRATDDTTQQSGQTPDKKVEIQQITVCVSGYIGAKDDTTVWTDSRQESRNLTNYCLCQRLH